MVNHCVVVGCTNQVGKKPGLSFYRFPSEKEGNRRERWATAIRREKWKPSKHSRICNEHFVSGKYITAVR